MTLPTNLRVNMPIPFPSLISATGPVVLTKINGIWNINFNVAQLPQLGGGFNPSTNILLVYDQIAGTFLQGTITQIVAAASTTVGAPQRIVTTSGAVTVLAGDSVIILNKTVGAPTIINLPTAASRNGAPIVVKDLKGDAQTNNVTFVANGVETIDGFSNAVAAANGAAVIGENYGKKSVTPLIGGGGWLVL